MPNLTFLAIDGLQARSIIQPSGVNELSEAVRRASAENHAIYPAGGQTMLDYGLPPTKPGIAIDLRSLNQVIDYPARDMTITVQAGITIQRLQEILATEKQRLPVDVPLADRATLGGAIACNVSGPRRYGLGTFRDYVIGISVVNDQGEEVKAGGRVVKNVAGYDLCKLYTGSLGTLGIITQVTLKVRPLPEVSTLVDLHCEPRINLAALLDVLHGSRTRPACISVLSPAAASDIVPVWEQHRQATSHAEGWCVVAGFEDNAEAVAWQVEELQREMAKLGIPLSRERPDGGRNTPVPPSVIPAEHSCSAHRAPLWTALTDFPLAVSAKITFKANLLSRAVADFCQFAEPLAPRLLAHAGNGIIFGHLPENVTLERASEAVRQLRERAVTAGGNLVLLRCPTEWKATLGVWGERRGEWELMKAVKRQLDPKDLFNPGRFVGGI